MAQKCDPFALGIGIGILLAIYAFLLGLIAWWWNWGTTIVQVMGSLYIGYAPTFLGSIIGAIWAFVDGLIAGVVIAMLYNKLQK